MRERQGISRRDFVRSAVAIGGASALAACLDRGESVDVPQGPDDTAGLPDRQHAWNSVIDTDEYGNHVMPNHHVLLLLEYADDDPVSDRTRVEETLTTLDRAYERGNDGLVYSIGYSPAYFDRFEGELPASVDLPDPEPMAPFEDPTLETADALVHLASDHGEVVLAAEEALKGELDDLNGRPVEASFAGVFEVGERRTGFIGGGLPAERQSEAENVPESDPVPDDSPLFMGFKTGFEANQASEDRVTIAEGPFEGATTTHLSHIRLNLRQWYEQDNREQRIGKMFCPAHAEEDRIEGVGENLGGSSGVGGCPAHMTQDAREGMVGHGQKAADAREDGEQVLLRRDFASTDYDQAGVHFLSHQEQIADFARVREAINGTDLASETAVGQRVNNGILQYMTVQSRGNFLVPPRRHRALPEPNPA